MFTITQIEEAHAKVKSGADFPSYTQALKQLGIVSYTIYVADGHSEYQGRNLFTLKTAGVEPKLQIAAQSNIEMLKQALQVHQQGQTDYSTFCQQAAEAGVEKWVVNLAQMTCSYYDTAGKLMVEELIPVAK